MTAIITFPYDNWEILCHRAEQVNTGVERYIHSALQLGNSVVNAYLDNSVLCAETHLAIVRFSAAEIVRATEISRASVQECDKSQAAEQSLVSEEERLLFAGLAREPVTFVLEDIAGHSVAANAAAMDASPSAFLRWTFGIMRSFYDKTVGDADTALFVTDATKDNIMRPIQIGTD